MKFFQGKQLINRAKFPARVRSVLLEILDAGEDVCTLRQETIAERVGCSLATVKRILGKLENEGMIVVGRSGRSNRTAIHWPAIEQRIAPNRSQGTLFDGPDIAQNELSDSSECATRQLKMSYQIAQNELPSPIVFPLSSPPTAAGGEIWSSCVDAFYRARSRVSPGPSHVAKEAKLLAHYASESSADVVREAVGRLPSRLVGEHASREFLTGCETLLRREIRHVIESRKRDEADRAREVARQERMIDEAAAEAVEAAAESVRVRRWESLSNGEKEEIRERFRRSSPIARNVPAVCERLCIHSMDD